MKRIFVLSLGLLLSGAVWAQSTPGAESNNNNRTTPALSGPGMSPKASGPAKPAAAVPKAPAGTNSDSEQATPSTVPQQPTTELLPDTGEAQPSADPLLATKPLPDKSMSLIGGKAVKVDKVRNRLVLEPFGSGKKLKINFDDRSHIYRDGRETTVMGINEGDRVYVDTMLYDGHIFARNLRVVTTAGKAESRGQVTAFDPRTGRVRMIDSLTGQPVTFQMSPNTAMNRRGAPTTQADLQPGALLDVMFSPGGTAQQISVLAVPGERYVFAGRVTGLDLSRGMLALSNESDAKNYELQFDPATVPDRNSLKVGTEVTAQATFDGRAYHVTQLTPMTTSAEQ